MKKLILVGASGFGREVAWLVERINKDNQEREIVGFLDDNEELKGEKINGYTVLGNIESVANYKDLYFVCCIGSSRIRKKVIENLKSNYPSIKFATLIDPSVYISKYTKVGEGSIICAGTILTVNINIGNHVIINLDCTIGHDAEIQDYVTLYPSVNISGLTKINGNTEIGTGSQVIQSISIGSNIIIGAGSCVVRNILDEGTYIGIPARLKN